MDFDPSSIPIPSAPPNPSGSSSDQQSAWANAAAALQRVAPPPAPPPPPPSAAATPFPWLMQQYSNGLAAANDAYTYPQHQGFGGAWNPNGPTRPQNVGWNGQNRLKNQFNQQRQQWNQQQSWQQNGQQQQQQQQWNNNGQSSQQQSQPLAAANNFKAFAFKQPMASRLPHLQNNFVKQGGGPMDVGGQVCEKAPQFGNVPDSVRSYMERSLAAAPAADHEKVMGYLEARLRPMLQSGSFKFINWDKEPLPHTKNYELNKQWTPAAKNLPKANPLASPEKKPQWAPPPKGTENRRRRRASSSSPSESGRSSEKRGWYEDREARSPSIEITGETKVGVRAGGGAGSGAMITVENGAMFRLASSVELARVRDKHRLQFLSKKEKKQLLQREKAEKKKEKANNKKEKKKLHFDYVDPHEVSRKQDRMRRFAQDVIVAAPAVPYRPSRNHIVIGTSNEIEKKYFRLTAAPDPATVRPLHVLRDSLALMKNKYKQNAEYRYMCDQFRSIRQDLTVQRIRNSFTVEVYEIHARIALENKDREEFNKCQSQLKVLYEEVEDCVNASEFTAYRLLYSMAMCNSTDVTTILRSLTPAMKETECVAYALRVRNKLTMGDQVGFFKLYESKAPLMCAYLLDMFVERERIAALNVFIKAYRPSLPVSLVAKWMAMDEDEFVEWMKEKKFAILPVGGELDCKTLSAVTLA
ncbi:hpo-10 [Pristionchus pacificus]|nr:hpo-10 [Pristionchus pacificus]